MARRKNTPRKRDWLFPAAPADDNTAETSVLDVLDNALNRGVVLTGDVVLGVANVDLVYLKLSVLLAALDKLTTNDPVLRPIAAGPDRKSSRSRRSRHTKTRR